MITRTQAIDIALALAPDGDIDEQAQTVMRIAGEGPAPLTEAEARGVARLFFAERDQQDGDEEALTNLLWMTSRGGRPVGSDAPCEPLSRGDVPPEVRPVPGVARADAEAREFAAMLASAAPEMAVTTGELPSTKTPQVDPICACGEPLSRHAIVGQYDPCPGGGGEFRDPPAGVPSIAGPAGLDMARKAGSGR